ncbi:HAD-IC family P-type ATPase [Salinarimonas rosea]|uniref:HAD-IC family P-type ATPase n=1 Tax=Salinarimonas rosea TaxID=552063 RepID=UPI0003F936E9|nr:HAD-IC family P-type ATPase [Salinarimonas rosea]
MSPRDDATRPVDDHPWHALAHDDALARLDTAPHGLTQDEAARRLERHGPNRLPQAKARGPLQRLADQVNSVLIWILLVSAAVTALLGHWIDTAVILAVVVANVGIGFVQEGKAEAALEAIRGMLAPHAATLRDGKRVGIPGEHLVPGDVVLVEAGDRVPADLRVVEARNLRIEEAALTGESVPSEKSVHPVETDAQLGDRASMAYSGTMVTAGSGRGVVVATGGRTEIGRISGLLADVGEMTTPLLRQIDTLAKTLAVVIVVAAALVLAFGLLVRDYAFDELFIAVVGLMVAAMPEGLPALLTITLAIGVQGMARRNAVVRRLPAIETLGAISVICSDKTGTLTRNEMMAATVMTADLVYEVTGEGYAPEGRFLRDGEAVDPDREPLLADLARAALLCNDAALSRTEHGWRVEGDPMEGALVALAAKAGFDPRAERAAWTRRDAVPFDAQHRFMATLDAPVEAERGAYVFVKGAPERILAMCDAVRGADGQELPLDRGHWHAAIEAIAAKGQRVLAFAGRPAGESEGVDEDMLDIEGVGDGLVLIGLVGLIDPPREEAVDAVAECHAAGIDVKMITGDHAATASAIARALGLGRPDDVLTGRDLDGLDDATLAKRVREVDVFARTSPEHKIRLVSALQAQGLVVAMTGDGVNDAPALKRADVGVAMGRKGSEAAKQAADMVLLDDDFATLEAAVRAGRTVYANLRKGIAFLLPINGGESASLVIALLAGLALPIMAVQILWVNMVSSVILGTSLAFEPPEPDVMRRRPRDPTRRILDAFLVWRVAFVSALFTAGIFGAYRWGVAQGLEPEAARTVAVNALVAMEIFYLFAVRYLDSPSMTLAGALGTPAVLIVVGAVSALQLVFTYAPFMNAIFGSRPLGWTEMGVALGAGVGVLVMLEAEKLVRRGVVRLRGRT